MCANKSSASGAAAWKLGMYVWELNRLYDIDPRCKSSTTKEMPYEYPILTASCAIGYNYEMSRVVPPQFDSYGVTFWIPSMLEPTLAMICASLPGLRPALGRISETFSSVFASTFGRSHLHQKHSDKAQISGGSDQPMYDWATHTIGGSTQRLHPHSATPSRDGKSKVSHSELSSTVGTIDDDDWRYHPESGGSVRYGLAV